VRNRTTKTLAAAVMATLLVVAAAAAAPSFRSHDAAVIGDAALAASKPATPGSTTLDLTGTVLTSRVILDAKPAGPSAGDMGYVTGNVFEHGKRVGRYVGTCTQLPRANQQCSFTLGLPKGQIAIQAAYGPGFNTGSVALEAVVGGTGAYAGAGGQGRDRELSDTRLAFHLVLTR
jgi:hypothetical protein